MISGESTASTGAPRPSPGRLDAATESYVATIVEAASRDASIARVLAEICGLEGSVRAGALDLVGAHLRTHDTAGDVFKCLDALKRDDVARSIAERLGG